MNFFRLSYSDISMFKGRLCYLHNGKTLNSGAFEIKDKSEFRILLPRQLGVVSVLAKIYNESFSEYRTLNCDLKDCDFYKDVFSVSLKGFDVGLYFVSFVIESVAGKLFGMKGTSQEIILKTEECGEHFQFSVTDFKYNAPSKYFGGIIYHIFVDRFYKGKKTVKKRSDAVMMNDWDGGIPEYPEYPGAHLENNSFFGGTLWGVIDKLDHISSLGVNLIYLSPIFEAYSNHKYDTGDYMKVDEMFGGDEALRKLIKEAKARGIDIILDGVFNHTGADSIYFNKFGKYSELGAYQSSDSKYYSWYDFQSHPDTYTCWWGIKILPRINPDIKECGDFLSGDGGVIEKYAKLGIAGFRLDVADELSDSFISKIKSKLNEHNKQSLLYGEVWEDGSNKIAYEKRKRYYLGDELDGVMNYPLREGIISFLRDKDTALLNYALTDIIFNAPIRIRNMQMNLLGTHDTERILTILAAKSAKGKTNAELSVMKMTPDELAKGIKLLKLAYVINATVPGIPAIFYGDEAGLEGYKDPFNRRPFPWNNINSELLEFYKKIGSIRTRSDVYRESDFKLLSLSQDYLIFARVEEKEAFVTVINNSDKRLGITFKNKVQTLINESNSAIIELDPFSAEIIKSNLNNKYEIINY